MIVLARLLLLERLRKLNLHYGWAGYASAGIGLLIFGWAGLDLAIPYMNKADFSLMTTFLTALWAAWTLFAAFTGKDLSWRINLQRILALPLPGFLRLYTLAFSLGFLSCPLLLALLVVPFWASFQAGLGIGGVFAVWTGCLLFAATVRMSASVARAVIYQARNLPGPLRSVALLAMAFITAATIAALFRFGIHLPHPGSLFSLVLSGNQTLYPLVCLIFWAAFLGLADLLIQRELIYSGTRGPLAPQNLSMHRCNLMLFHPAWPGPLFRVGILGWLRSRSALLLFVWGGIYSIFWTWYSKPDDVFYFFLFIWMNLLFHSYLRGNLLGTDRGGVWLYYMLPFSIDRALSSKSLSLSLLQSCMILSLLAAGSFRAGGLIDLADWCRIISYAISGILVGEICGFFFSIKYPDSIDRNSQFDGGTTVGALIVPVLQILFLFLFILISERARHFHLSGAFGAVLVSVPLFLFTLRRLVLKTWVCKTMLQDREVLLKKLSG